MSACSSACAWCGACSAAWERDEDPEPTDEAEPLDTDAQLEPDDDTELEVQS